MFVGKVDPMCKYFGAPCKNEPSTCVNYNKLCDGTIDCVEDGSDEGSHCNGKYCVFYVK